jgi:hypothetical protein
MRPQPLICVRDVEASSRWYQQLLGCRSDHGGLSVAAHRTSAPKTGKPSPISLIGGWSNANSSLFRCG